MSKQPIGKVERTLTSGRTAVKVGGKVLLHYVKRPFMGADERRKDQDKTIRQSSKTLFEGLSLLKGTALKMAQMLSQEIDLLPEAACLELAKAYHQVPPINRALVRRVIGNELGSPPEELFNRFDPTAFAAASLGQVHAAESKDGVALAVKIQYPGIAKTIDHDIGMIRQLLRPVISKDQLMPTLSEISARLHEEVNYYKEALNLNDFAGRMKIDGVRIPHLVSNRSTQTVLTTSLMPGKPLDQWLLEKPDQEAVDHVAQKLQQIYISGVYELNAIHADPNPGNFIIDQDLNIGLVDFGCIKKLSPQFVEHYRRLCKAAYHRNHSDHFKEIEALRIIPENLGKDILTQIKTISHAVGQWFGALCEKEKFDFSAHPNFIAQGKTAMTQFHHLQRYLKINPHIIFLDRTRYGLLRLFEQMGARVCFRNPYEWDQS